jgi:hypothetical protein
MNPKVRISLTIEYVGAVGGARLIISRRRKLDRAAAGTGPKKSKDVLPSDFLYRNMFYTQTVLNSTTHLTRYECFTEVPHRLIKKLRTRSDADLSPDTTKRKNMLSASVVVINDDGEIIAKVSLLLTE